MRTWLPIALALPFAALGCETVDRQPVATNATATVEWSLDHRETAGVVVSVWGASPNDVWAAGGQKGRGLLLHNVGDGWKPVEVDAPGLIWSVYGITAPDVYAAGENGVVLHFDGTSWRRIESGTTQTLYGIWTADGRDVWIVGGDPQGKPGDAVILRGSAEGFRPVDDVPAAFMPDALFKIYGTSRALIAVGRNGTVLRHDGTSWKRDAVPTTGPLISLWGRGANDVYAVGGQATGVMLHFDGDAWSDVTDVGFGPQLFGVFTAPGEPVFTVGADSQVLEMTTGQEMAAYEAPGLESSSVLHAVWGDGQGSVYAVGGSLFSYPNEMSGVILRRTTGAP